MRQLLATMAVMATAACPVSAQRGGPDSLQRIAAARESRAAATAGLDTLRALAVQHFQRLGFSDPTQAAGATLSTPMVEFYVRLDSLRAYSPGANPSALLAGGDKVVYPVVAGGSVRSSIELARTRAAWRPVAYGGATFAAALVRQRSQSIAGTNRAESEYFIVRVPALGLVFLGANSAGTFTLTPLLDDSRGRWKAGVSSPAAIIFAQLSADAKASKGLPM
jgi:hypothetical protein